MHSLKLSHYLPPQHQIHGELERWADELRERTDGALDVEVFPAGQMGPPPRQFDLARTGVADLAFVYTALSPGRFPLTDTLSLPFVLADDEGEPISTADASWLATSMKPTIGPEFVGTEMLYAITSTATGFFMRDREIRAPEDLEGLRVRPTSAFVADQLVALGASPATVSPGELADAIGKGVIDGAVFNFEAARAFGMQGAVERVSLLANAAVTFALVINADALESLPGPLAEAILETTGPEAARRVGALYDEAEAAGREFLETNGTETLELRGADAEPFREALAPVAEAHRRALDEAGHDADAVVARIRELAAGS